MVNWKFQDILKTYFKVSTATVLLNVWEGIWNLFLATRGFCMQQLPVNMQTGVHYTGQPTTLQNELRSFAFTNENHLRETQFYI